MDREARTRSASRFLILFGFGVTSGYLGQQNSDQQITASIANKGQHDSKGYFRKRESMKQPLKFIQLLRKTGSACTAGTKQPRQRVSKRIKIGSTKYGMILWMQASSVTGYSSLFVHTNPVNSTGKMLQGERLAQASPIWFRLFNTAVGSTLAVEFQLINDFLNHCGRLC